MLNEVLARIIRCSAWNLLSSVALRMSGLITGMIVSRIVGKDDFGSYSIVLVTIGTFYSISGAGFGTAAARYIAEHRTSDPAQASAVIRDTQRFAIIAASAAALLIFMFSKQLAGSVFAAPHIDSLLAASSIWMFLSIVTAEQNGVLTGFEAFRQTSAVNFIYALISVVSSGLAAAYCGITGVIAANTLSAGVLYLMNCRVIHLQRVSHGMMATAPKSHTGPSLILQYSLPALLSSIIVYPANWTCTALLSRQPDGVPEVGIYNIASQWRNLVVYLPGVVSMVFVSVLANRSKLMKDSDTMKIYAANLGLNIVFSVATAAPMIIFSETVMSWYGQEFSHGSKCLTAMLISGCLLSVITVAGQAMVLQTLIWPWFWLNLIWASALICFSWVFRMSGSYGVALANVIAFSIHLLNIMIYLGVRTLFMTSSGNKEPKCPRPQKT